MAITKQRPERIKPRLASNLTTIPPKARKKSTEQSLVPLQHLLPLPLPLPPTNQRHLEQESQPLLAVPRKTRPRKHHHPRRGGCRKRINPPAREKHATKEVIIATTTSCWMFLPKARIRTTNPRASRRLRRRKNRKNRRFQGVIWKTTAKTRGLRTTKKF